MIEVVSEFSSAIVRFLGYCCTEIVIELMCRGMGYRICRIFSPSVKRESFGVFITGFVFWLIVLVGGAILYSAWSQLLQIDSCLDIGGSFNYQSNSCDLPPL